MTDFDELFMVQINKMIEKKTGAPFLIVYVIYDSLVSTDNKRTVLFTPPTAGFMPFVQLLEGNKNANLYTGSKGNKWTKERLCEEGTGRFMSVNSICLFHYALDNQNWLVFVCFAQYYNNQLDVQHKVIVL